ncbi:hypothetical protein A3Q56_04062, partial [Intoshia linei]
MISMYLNLFKFKHLGFHCYNRICHYPIIIYNILLCKFNLRKWYVRVDENVVIGALPINNVLEMLHQTEKVKGIISLVEKYEMKRFIQFQ